MTAKENVEEVVPAAPRTLRKRSSPSTPPEPQPSASKRATTAKDNNKRKSKTKEKTVSSPATSTDVAQETKARDVDTSASSSARSTGEHISKTELEAMLTSNREASIAEMQKHMVTFQTKVEAAMEAKLATIANSRVLSAQSSDHHIPGVTGSLPMLPIAPSPMSFTALQPSSLPPMSLSLTERLAVAEERLRIAMGMHYIHMLRPQHY